MGPRRALIVEHQPDAHAGYIGERACEHGARLVVHRAGEEPFPDPRGFDYVVVLGSGDAAYDESVPYLAGELAMLAKAVDAQVPVFGICFGAQILARALGGEVRQAPRPEIGWLKIDTDAPEVVEPGPWLVWHFDVLTPPAEGVEVARTEVGCQAFTCGPHLGVQFHPEATVPSIAAWAAKYAAVLPALGLDAATLHSESEQRMVEARAAAHRLLDRFLVASGLAAD